MLLSASVGLRWRHGCPIMLAASTIDPRVAELALQHWLHVLCGTTLGKKVPLMRASQLLAVARKSDEGMCAKRAAPRPRVYNREPKPNNFADCPTCEIFLFYSVNPNNRLSTRLACANYVQQGA